MEFCRFRDFAVPLLGLSTRDPSIHEMRTTRLMDSSFRPPHLADAARTRLCSGADDFTIYSGQIRAPHNITLPMAAIASAIPIIRHSESTAESQPNRSKQRRRRLD
jgi:hypothetical protein